MCIKYLEYIIFIKCNYNRCYPENFIYLAIGFGYRSALIN